MLGQELNVLSEELYKVLPQYWPNTIYDSHIAFPDTWLQSTKLVIMGFTGFHGWTGKPQRLDFKWRLNPNSLEYFVG